jgi:hypothetical protein
LEEDIEKLSFLQKAQRLQALGFHVFPLEPNGKRPAIMDFPNAASTEFTKSQLWWRCPVTEIEQPYNIAISTSKFRLDERLLVVDIDDKGDKHGSEEIIRLEVEGKNFPPTFSQRTASGGTHLVYRTQVCVRNSASSLAHGIDVRGMGGFIVACGSEIDGAPYTADFSLGVNPAPEWLEEFCKSAPQAPMPQEAIEADAGMACERAKSYLATAPIAVSGAGGNAATFGVICRLKDLGCDMVDVVNIISEWNERCIPPWDDDELLKLIENVYRYGKNPVGVAAPEADFQPVIADDAAIGRETGTHPDTDGQEEGSSRPQLQSLSPIEKLNSEYAFVLAGSGHRIIHETVDEKGRFRLERINEQTFHAKHLSQVVDIGGDKPQLATRLWMRSLHRRTFQGFCFAPGQKETPGYYNLFRGFDVEPFDLKDTPPKRWVDAVEAFKLHALENVCHGNQEHFDWLMGYFAHLFQRPGEKPLVALVLKGSKGVGKNALVERVCNLLGGYSLVVASNRYLTGNFNSHLEKLLLFVLDEAFWSGNKAANGVLKDLVTGTKHFIERKGEEPYEVANLTRVVILGNERWIVPASEDERRFAVFNVGEGKKLNQNFFREMREGMEDGGYRLLLRYFLDFDLSTVDINTAPITEALHDQKYESLDCAQQWIYECLAEGEIVGAPYDVEWMPEIDKSIFKDAMQVELRRRGVTTWLPTDTAIAQEFRRCLPHFQIRRRRVEGKRERKVFIGTLEQSRKAWSNFIGHDVKWD